MARENRAAGRRAERAGASAPAPLRQLPWRALVNPYPPMEILSADQIEAVHLTSLRILEELGIEAMSGRALDLLARAGADVDRASMMVRLDRSLVAEAMKTAPSRFRVTPRNKGRALEFGGRSVVFGLVAGPANVHDLERGRRPGNFADFQDLIRLGQSFNCIHLIGNQVVAPIDLPANSRHLDAYRTNLTLSDRAYHCSAIGRGRALDGIAMMAIAKGLTLEEARHDPGVLSIISVNSPRRFDEAMAEGLMTMAEFGQPVVVTPFTLMGAMTPVTIAAALAQQNAEALFGIVLAQLVNPGCPVVYGAFTSNVDMRSGAPAFGTPENAKANVAGGQMARRYGLPYRSSNCNASNAPDAQAIWETQMALWGAILGGANLVYHAAGWLEGGLTASFEKIVLDVEMLQHMIEFLHPIDTSEAELGFEAIKNVPTGGHFFGEAHTLERYERAFYEPLLSDWRNYESWREAGAPDATTRATAIWKRALAEYQQPPMDEGIAEALESYVAKRREEIGAGEP